MRNIWTVFKTDIRTLSKCFFACVVVVAIAHKLARIAWALVAHGRAYEASWKATASPAASAGAV